MSVISDGFGEANIRLYITARIREHHVKHHHIRAVRAQVIYPLRVQPAIPFFPIILIQIVMRNLVHL